MKVGIVGLGVMGRNHLRVLSSMPSVSGLVLFDPLGEKVGLAAKHPVVTSFERFLDEGMDYCVVSSPTSTHLEVGLALADKRIPALIEKPLAVNQDDGQRLIQAFSQAEVIAAVGHVERFNPAILAMKSKLEEGLLGEIYQLSTRRVGPYSGRISDVGVVKDLASHDIDLVQMLSGSSYMNLDSRTLSPMGNTHEDMVLAIGSLRNGWIVNHLVNWLSPTKERVTSIVGQTGMLIADTLAVDLYFYEKGSQKTNWDGISIYKGSSEGAVHKYRLEKTEPLVNEHEAFQRALVENSDIGLASLKDGLRVLEVAEKILQSGVNPR